MNFSEFVGKTLAKNKKGAYKILNFLNVHVCGRTLFVEYLFHPLPGLISMSWLHDFNERNEQQKKSNYSKKKSFSQNSKYLRNKWKKLLE